MPWFKSKEEKQAKVKIKFLVPQVRRILAESLQIINSTENIKTGVGRFETIKTLLQRLLYEILDIREKLIQSFPPLYFCL